MLAGILSLMGDLPKVRCSYQSNKSIPLSSHMQKKQLCVNEHKLITSHHQIDYDELGRRVGIAYGRNARASAKKLFDKIKQTTPAGANGVGPTTNMTAVSQSTPKKTNTTPQKTKYQHPPAKRSKIEKEEDVSEENSNDFRIGQKRKAPTRKAASVMAQTKTANTEHSGSPSEGDDSGKLTFFASNSPTRNMDSGLVYPTSNKDHKTGNLSYTPYTGYSEEEEKQDAADRGLTVKQWRQWRLDNNYDQLF